MGYKILLAILLGYMLRFIAAVGVQHYLKISKSDDELRSYVGFHLSAISYLVGSGLRFGGFLLLVAYLIKTYLL